MSPAVGKLPKFMGWEPLLCSGGDQLVRLVSQAFSWPASLLLLRCLSSPKSSLIGWSSHLKDQFSSGITNEDEGHGGEQWLAFDVLFACVLSLCKLK